MMETMQRIMLGASNWFVVFTRGDGEELMGAYPIYSSVGESLVRRLISLESVENSPDVFLPSRNADKLVRLIKTSRDSQSQGKRGGNGPLV